MRGAVRENENMGSNDRRHDITADKKQQTKKQQTKKRNQAIVSIALMRISAILY